jgi:glycosyltransferase involved in cell wall biosynthesis
MRKNLLFCIQNLNIGGPQKSLLSLLYELDYKKYNVDLLIWSKEGSLIPYLPPEVNVVNIPEIHSYIRISTKETLLKSIKLIFKGEIRIVIGVISTIIKYRKNMVLGRQYFWEKYRYLFKKLKKEYDIAIAVSGGNLAYFICDCVNASKKFTWVRSDYRVLRRDKRIDGEYFAKVNGILTVSNICKEILDTEFPEFEAKTFVFYNLLPFKLYEKMDDEDISINRQGDEKIFLTIARLDPNKGLDLAIKAMRILKDKGYKIKWYVLGDGSYKNVLKQMIRENNLEDDFILLGFKNNTYSYIKECDIFVHPSRFEGKSNAVDEAKFACKPIVVTNYPTVAEQVTNLENGLVVDMTEESLSNGIIKILEEPELMLKFVKNLKESREVFDSSIEKFEKIIENNSI